jgi:hypothetical protein
MHLCCLLPCLHACSQPPCPLRAPAIGRRPSPWHLVSCPSRSSRHSCVVVFWSYLTITGDAPFGQSNSCHLFIYGSPVSPLLSRTTVAKCTSTCANRRIVSVPVIRVGLLGHFVHISITTPIVPALKNYQTCPRSSIEVPIVFASATAARSETAVAKPFQKRNGYKFYDGHVQRPSPNGNRCPFGCDGHVTADLNSASRLRSSE